MPIVFFTYDQIGMPAVLEIAITNEIGPVEISEFLSAQTHDHTRSEPAKNVGLANTSFGDNANGLLNRTSRIDQ